MNMKDSAVSLGDMPFLLETPQEISIIVHEQLLPESSKTRKEIIASPLPLIGVLQPAGKTQVFRNGKTCPIFPSFNAREWCLYFPDFSLLQSTFPEKKNLFFFFLNHKIWLLVNFQLTRSPISQWFNTSPYFTL